MAGGADRVEYQMLMGLRDSTKKKLVREGHRVVEYVPYGDDWYGYGIRRLTEKKRNLLYFIQGFMGR
jgi:proline dehydrogenase